VTGCENRACLMIALRQYVYTVTKAIAKHREARKKSGREGEVQMGEVREKRRASMSSGMEHGSQEASGILGLKIVRSYDAVECRWVKDPGKKILFGMGKKKEL